MAHLVHQEFWDIVAAMLAAICLCFGSLTASEAFAMDGKLTVGVILPLSGAFANEGQQMIERHCRVSEDLRQDGGRPPGRDGVA